MVKSYIPARGDIVWLDFNPQAGHEQAGHRPALVISPKIYNEKSGLLLACPLTSKVKGYPFAVELASKDGGGCILVDQIKSLDWKARHAKFKNKIPRKVMEEVVGKIEVLIFGDEN